MVSSDGSSFGRYVKVGVYVIIDDIVIWVFPIGVDAELFRCVDVKINMSKV